MVTNIKNIHNLFLEIGIFLILLLLSFGSTILKSVITKEPIVDESDLEYLQFGKIISLVIIVPFLEEFFFRGFLNFEKDKISFVLFVIVTLFFVSMIANKKISVIVSLIIVLLSVILLFSSYCYKGMTNFISDYLIILVVISSVCFGFIHFTNYEDFKLSNLLIILPKILFGFFAAYIITRHNIWVALMYHCINNLVPTLIIYFKMR